MVRLWIPFWTNWIVASLWFALALSDRGWLRVLSLVITAIFVLQAVRVHRMIRLIKRELEQNGRTN